MSKIYFNQKLYPLTLFILYLLVNSFNFYQHGIKLVNDSARYIEYATNLHDGFYIDTFNIWYIGYPLIIFLFQFFTSGYELLIVFQYVLGLLAVYALYKTSLNLWNNPLSAFITGALYILFIDIAQWNSYVLTESVYASFTCFSIYALSLLYTGKRSLWIYLLTFALITFTFFIKPTGVGLLGATLSLVLYEIITRVKARWVKIAIGICTGLLFLILVNRMLEHYLIMENYQKGEIIYAVTTLPETSEYKLLVVTPPDNVYVPPEDSAPLFKIVSFFFHHPIYWLKLFFAKAFYFFAHVRPYWSITHNLYSLVILLPCYFFFFKGLRKEKREVVLFAVVYCALHSLSICITSEDWDGRFLIPMLPVVFLAGKASPRPSHEGAI
jgi:4-amino-4-deoxy-L-arabinose transferase-like glycosyltransferase